MIEKSLKELDLPRLSTRRFFPSPPAWEDQVLYFMMLDRFSNGKEKGYLDNDGNAVTGGTIPQFRLSDAGNAVRASDEASRWREAGGKWVGGTLQGLMSKMGYLKRLGVTAIWISPIFKQVSFQDTYHGYGIQNFLDVDPHFGTRDDLQKVVTTAHDHGLLVILDIILNHSGNVFSYDPTVESDQRKTWFPRWDGNPYTVKGFHDKLGASSIPFSPVDPTRHSSVWPDGAIWPAEFQDPNGFTQKGYINNWDYEPEFLEGDFSDLKDIHLGQGPVDSFLPSPALLALCDIYKFWIAFADIDGFRVDTVKHMGPGAARFFTSVIHEFAQTIGKENFYLIGEITGGRERAFNTLEMAGMNAALGIDDIPDKLEYLVKGYRNPSEYFGLFRNSLLVQKESHVWFKNKVVTVFDDHDQVRKGRDKARFCAGNGAEKNLVLNALFLNATTLGIPCLYYGTEQEFDGAGDSDRYIREAMFGGDFGAFRTKNRHFFNEETTVYKELAKILALRREKIALRRGRQYLRQISGDGVNFGLPEMIGGQIRSVVPWSRIFGDREMLLAINTDPEHPRTAWVIVDKDLHRDGDHLQCIYSTDAAQVKGEIRIKEVGMNTKAVSLTVPPAGCVIYE
jgi:glycosidase